MPVGRTAEDRREVRMLRPPHPSFTIVHHEGTTSMRKLIVANIVSLGGRYEGPDGNVMALPMDEAFDLYDAERLAEADAMLPGTTTYELFRSFWPRGTQATRRQGHLDLRTSRSGVVRAHRYTNLGFVGQRRAEIQAASGSIDIVVDRQSYRFLTCRLMYLFSPLPRCASAFMVSTWIRPARR